MRWSACCYMSWLGEIDTDAPTRRSDVTERGLAAAGDATQRFGRCRSTLCSQSTWRRKARTMSIEKRDVMFKSGDTFSAAWLFVPDQARSGRRVPAVAMAHGIGYVKEMYLEPFARRFAAAGIAALVFDYRGFGGSGGEPRPRVFPHDQMEGYRNALTWLSLQPERRSHP